MTAIVPNGDEAVIERSFCHRCNGGGTVAVTARRRAKCPDCVPVVSPFAELSPPYSTIVADPPWPVRQPPKKFGGTGNADLPYSTMTVADIAAMPVGDIADDYCHLYLWTVNRFVPDTYEIMRAWGFRPSMLLTWCKEPIGQGPGREFASTTEFVLMGLKGSRAGYPPVRIDRNWWVWPRGAHSVKPAAFLDIVEQVSPGPYVEMFARQPRLGWDSWGYGYESQTETEWCGETVGSDTTGHPVHCRLNLGHGGRCSDNGHAIAPEEPVGNGRSATRPDGGS